MGAILVAARGQPPRLQAPPLIASTTPSRTVIEACRKHGIHPGMGGVYDPKLMEKYIGYGMRFILSGGDLGFLMAGARERANFLHGLKL